MPNAQNALVGGGITLKVSIFTFPLCCPSRASIQTGLYPHNHGVLDNEGPLGGYAKFQSSGMHERTVASWLDASGYETAYFGRYMNSYKGQYVPGWDEMHSWKYTKRGVKLAGYPGYVKSGGAMSGYLGAKAAEYITAEHQEPFFAFVGFNSPHAPYAHPKRYDSLFQDLTAPRTPDMGEADVSDKPAYIRKREGSGMKGVDERYRDAVRSMQPVDKFIGRVVSELEASGELDNTYIFYWTDNAVHVGNHRLPYGKRTPYESDISFPLLVRGPGIAPGTESTALVGNHDIAPTLAEIAGTSVGAPLDGRSFASVLNGDPLWGRDALLIRGGGDYAPRWEGVRTPHYTYVEYKTGERELYDLQADPYQLENLAGSEAASEVQATLAARLDALRVCATEICKAAEGP